MKKGDRYSEIFTVDSNVYEGFINVFKDRNPLHTQDSFAQEKGFEKKVMQGNILNGFISYFIGECLPVKDVMILSQQINFTSPVYLNDRLQFVAEISDFIESVNVIEIKYVFSKEDTTIVAKGKIQIKLI